MSSVTEITGWKVLASDGELGKVVDIYFDDEQWVVRYLVVDTGGWLSGRKVLLSPYAVKVFDTDASTVFLNVTRDAVERGPAFETERPVSRLYEAAHLEHYGYPNYWNHNTFWPGGSIPAVMAPIIAPGPELLTAPAHSEPPQHQPGVSHLRSASQVTGYRIHATDENVGHVVDFLFDEHTWAIGALVVDTGNWLRARQVLVSRHAIRDVAWPEKLVTVDRSRSQIEASPAFDPKQSAATDIRLAKSESPPRQPHQS